MMYNVFLQIASKYDCKDDCTKNAVYETSNTPKCADETTDGWWRVENTLDDTMTLTCIRTPIENILQYYFPF